MTLLGMPFGCAVDSFGWGALIDFVRHLPPESAVYRAKYSDASRFASNLQRNAILADLYDEIAAFYYSFAKVHGGKGNKPDPYPRPWVSGNAQKIGSEPIPIEEFNRWYYGGE